MSVKLPELRQRLSSHEEERPGCWARWKGRLWSWGAPLAGAALSTAALLSKKAWSTTLGALGLGASVEAAFETAAPAPYKRLLHRAVPLLASQSVLFFLTQLWENTDSEETQKGAEQAIIGLLGAFVCLYASKKRANPYIRVESDATGYEEGAKFKGIFFPAQIRYGAAFAASVASLAISMQEKDPVYKGFAAFFSTYYIASIAGRIAIEKIDAVILKRSTAANLVGQTRWRAAKTYLLTAAPFFISTMLVPLDTHDKVHYFYAQGTFVGFFDAALQKSFENRLENIPIVHLSELQLAPLEENPCVERTSEILFAPWLDLIAKEEGCWSKAAVGTLSALLRQADVLGLIAFCVWQMGWDLEDDDQRDALGTLLASFVGTTALGLGVQELWRRSRREEIQDPSLKQRLLDKTMVFFHISPKVLGVHPAYIFSILTHSLAMDDRAMQEGESAGKKALLLLAWASYGIGWAVERIQAQSAYLGAEPKMPLMFLTNAVLTALRRIQKEIP